MLSGSLSPSFRNNSNSSASFASDSGKSYKILSRSSVVSKPSQATHPQDLHQQIAILKQKAHQSFMQVIQVQQLHEEEMEEMRREFEQKEVQYQSEIAQLKLKMYQLETENVQMHRNTKHHICQVSGMDFTLDAIEPINCQQESKLDDSSINSFIELVALQGGEQHLRTVRQQMLNQLKNISTDHNQQIVKVQNMVQRLFDYISHLKRQFFNLQEVYGQLKSRMDREEEGNVSAKQNNDNLQKENKFMGEQIKRLAGQKMRVERKTSEQEKMIKRLEQQVRKYQEYAKKGVKSHEGLMKKHKEENDSMDLNDFIEQNMHTMNNMMRSQPLKQPKWVISKAHH